MSTSWLEIRAEDGRVLGYVELTYHPNPDVSTTEDERHEVESMLIGLRMKAVVEVSSEGIPADFKLYDPAKPVAIPPHRVSAEEVYLKLHGIEYHVPVGHPGFAVAQQAVYSQRWADIPQLFVDYHPPVEK